MLRSERYRRLITAYCKYGSYIGVDIVRPDYKMSGLTYFTISTIIAYFVLTFYTIYIKVADDWIIVLECLVFSGCVFQGIAKLYSGNRYSLKVYETVEWIHEIYETYEKKSAEFAFGLEKSIARMELVWRITTILYISTISALILLPIGVLLIVGKKILIVNYELPLLSPETNTGYWTTYAVHFVQVMTGGAGNFLGDMMFMFYIIHSTLIYDIFEMMLQNLDDALLRNDNIQEIKQMVKDILAMHQEYCRYCKELKDVWSVIIFTQITTSTFSMSIVLFTIFAGNWLAAYAFFLFALFIIFAYCGLGTVVDATNDLVTDRICSCLWYKLPIEEQKLIMVMMVQSQHPVILDVGGILPLNVNTAVQVLKTIYSYMMMLLNFVAE